MIFIFGGMYQGKREFALENLDITEEMIYGPTEISLWIQSNLPELIGPRDETSEKIDRPISGDKSRRNEKPKQDIVLGSSEGNGLDAFIESLRDKVVIMNDISQGLVPMDPKDRAVREASGRLMIRLAQEADSVYRVFCGIGEKVK